MAHPFDIGSQLAVYNGYTLAISSAAAGITTASTASMGREVDLTALGRKYHSVKAAVSLFSRITSTSGSGYHTVGLRIETADSSNSTAFDANLTTETTYVFGSTADGVAANHYGIHSQDVSLAGAEKWIRMVVTIDPTCTSSADTIQAEGVLVFGGATILPAT